MKWFSRGSEWPCEKIQDNHFPGHGQDLYEVAPGIKNFQSQKRFHL